MEELPPELLWQVFMACDRLDRVVCRFVCLRWRDILSKGGAQALATSHQCNKEPRSVGVRAGAGVAEKGKGGDGSKEDGDDRRDVSSPPIPSDLARQWLAGSYCSELAERGTLGTLEWARRNGAPWDSRVPSSAARGGHVEVLKFWLEEVTLRPEERRGGGGEGDQGAKGEHLIDRPGPSPEPGSPGSLWPLWVCSMAAGGGHLDALEWLLEHGAPWLDDNPYMGDECASAARNGHIGVLEWAVDNGAPYTQERVCIEAAMGGHIAVLDWAEGRGWTVPCDVYYAAVCHDREEVVDWGLADVDRKEMMRGDINRVLWAAARHDRVAVLRKLMGSGLLGDPSSQKDTLADICWTARKYGSLGVVGCCREVGASCEEGDQARRGRYE